MTQLGARSAGAAHDSANGSGRRRGLTPAQWYCLLIGLSLLLAGVFGFLADASFDTGGTGDADRTGNADGQLQGDGFLGFEVNAWHNIVHLLSGLVLLAAFRRRGPAKTVALAFGVIYGIVAIIGLINGSDVLGIIPVNGADNVLHIALSALGILTALMSRGDNHRGTRDRPVEHRRDRGGDRGPDRDPIGDRSLGGDRVGTSATRDAADRVRR
jgi:hypothetical protein